MASPTVHTVAECKRRGWRACIVEKWIPQARRRVDAFGFGDLLVMDGEPGALLIQACTTGDAPKRVHKIHEECTADALRWLKSGNRIEVWGWAKRGKVGKRKLWTLKTYPVTAYAIEEGIDYVQPDADET